MGWPGKEVPVNIAVAAPSTWLWWKDGRPCTGVKITVGHRPKSAHEALLAAHLLQ